MRADDGARLPFQRRLAPAEQAGLVGLDPDEHPVAHFRVADAVVIAVIFRLPPTSFLIATYV